MIDPVVQATDEYHNKLARDDRAIEAMAEVIRERVTLFEEFLRLEKPDYFDVVNNTTKFLEFVNHLPKDAELRVDWDQYVLEEAKSLVEG